MTTGASLAKHAAPAAATSLSLHPHRLRIGPAGVEPFHCPVAPDELVAARDVFLLQLFDWIRARDIDRDPDAELIWLNAAQITVEVLRLLNGYAVQRRLTQAGHRLENEGEGTALFGLLATGQAPDPSGVTQRTFAGLRPEPGWKRSLRVLKYAFGRSGPSYKPRSWIRPGRDIVTFSASELILANAAAADRTIVLSKFGEWMPTGSLSGDSLPAGAGRDALRDVVALAQRSFAAVDVALPPFLAANIETFADSLTRRTRFYLEPLSAAPERLPQAFWSGSSGILYNRVMARAVSKAGGEVTGHDHGTSSGLWSSCLPSVTEFNFVQRFVTYSEPMAQGLRRHLDRRLLARPDSPCAIVPVRRAAASAPKSPRGNRTRTGRKPRLLYVMTAYTGDSVYLEPLLPDAVAVDWQARLLDFLAGEGFHLSLKPHPDSYCRPPDEFQRLYDAEVVDQPFEEVMHEADLLLLDYWRTSCLVSALRTDVPMVLIEFPQHAPDPEARKLLERRAAIVAAGFGDDGRADTDWASLRRALAAAPGLGDPRFVESYYPQ